MTAEGAVTGDGSARAVALASALYGDLKAFDASAGARPSDSLTSAGGEQIGTATDALTYSCGATIYPGHWVRCGTVFLGETSICITNNTGAHGVAYIDWFGQNFGIYPYNRTCTWRWFWGADVYVQKYCRLSQTGQEATFHVDHVQPRQEGGLTTLENLALACVSRSLRKGARTHGEDPLTGAHASLFHPRWARWEDHVEITGELLIVGKTPTGRATVELLRMNRPLVVEIRREEALRGRFR